MQLNLLCHKRSIVAVFLVMLVYPASVAWSSGFGVFTQGASALGQADSVVAHSDGPSALFFNPALMNKLPGTQVEIGTTLLFPNREYIAPDGTTTSTRDTVFAPSTFYLTHSFNDTISAGLAVFNPFGLGTDWGSDWGGTTPVGGLGRFLATNSELTTWNINPAVSYRILPSLSVAGGMDILLLDATLESAAPPNALIPVEYRQKFTGSGNGIGYNFGAYFEVNDMLSVGASYRSKVKIEVDGDLSLSVSPQSVSGKTTITLPQQLFAGIAYRPDDRLTLETGMRWEDWSSFKQLQITVAGQPPVISPRDWHSTFAINAGGKYQLNKSYSVMAGYLYGWNPVPDSTFEPAIPDSDTHLFCAGGEARFDRLKIVLSYAYQLQYDRSKSTNQYGALANGNYTSDVNLLGLSVGYSF
jgi:long-chain fatty acid transport protein